jgi:hypothetical protein
LFIYLLLNEFESNKMYLFLIVNGDIPQFKNRGFISYQAWLFVAEEVCNMEPIVYLL